jgi:hypothetical protein
MPHPAKRRKRNVVITLAAGLACWLFAAAQFSEISRLGKLAEQDKALVARAMASDDPKLRLEATDLMKDIDSRIKKARVTGPALALAGLILVGFAGVDALRLKRFQPPAGRGA